MLSEDDIERIRKEEYVYKRIGSKLHRIALDDIKVVQCNII